MQKSVLRPPVLHIPRGYNSRCPKLFKIREPGNYAEMGKDDI
ncbi:MAG: hypothetical protein ACFFAV_13640 [Candidatus Hermodarchaeota archaeon]